MGTGEHSCLHGARIDEWCAAAHRLRGDEMSGGAFPHALFHNTSAEAVEDHHTSRMSGDGRGCAVPAKCACAGQQALPAKLSCTCASGFAEPLTSAGELLCSSSIGMPGVDVNQDPMKILGFVC